MSSSRLTTTFIHPLRIGLIVPSSNTVMEPEFHLQKKLRVPVVTSNQATIDMVRQAADSGLSRAPQA